MKTKLTSSALLTLSIVIIANISIGCISHKPYNMQLNTNRYHLKPSLVYMKYTNDTIFDNNQKIINFINKKRYENGVEPLIFDTTNLRKFAYHRNVQIVSHLWSQIYIFNIPKISKNDFKLVEHGGMDTINNMTDRRIMRDIKKYVKIVEDGELLWDSLRSRAMGLACIPTNNYALEHNITVFDIPKNIYDSLWNIGLGYKEEEMKRIKKYYNKYISSYKFFYNSGEPNLSEELKIQTIKLFLNSEQGKEYKNIKEFIIEATRENLYNLLNNENSFINENYKKISFTTHNIGYKYFVVELSE